MPLNFTKDYSFIEKKILSTNSDANKSHNRGKFCENTMVNKIIEKKKKWDCRGNSILL